MASKSATESTAIMDKDVKVNIGVKDDARKKIAEILNMRLCDEYVLYTKTRKYHWNVVGSRFHQLHEFFEEQYEALDEMVDEIAERVRQLGAKSLGTLDEFVRHSSINEEPGQNPDAQAMISNLLADHETIVQTLRNNIDDCEEKYHDTVTSNLLQDAVQKHEKMAWMLRAHLEGKNTV
ncbi:MAG TPA: DNA starvation/stationary phase protection protein [Nitrososphaera sp.]|nr:DNA starvation/stationary phase protection protein [Nitrososphaera sp.]